MDQWHRGGGPPWAALEARSVAEPPAGLGRQRELIARKPWRQQGRRSAGLPKHLGTCCSFGVVRLERPSTAVPESHELHALVVLGCRVRDGEPSRALESRLELARSWQRDHAESQRALEQGTPLPIVVSGGRAWDGVREAMAMAEWLERRGVASEQLILEAESLTTRQNARKVAAVLASRGWRRIGLVTSDFHMRRAARLFRREGAWVLPLPARSQLGFLTRTRLELRELGAYLLGPFEPR